MITDIFMTSPSNYGVKYEINPWMKNNIKNVDTEKAIKQWESVRSALGDIGVTVTVTPKPPDNCPDAVFAANAGLIFDSNKFILSSFHNKERASEEQYFYSHMSKYFSMKYLDNAGDRKTFSFEGAGDALFDNQNRLWLGSGFRTTNSARNDIVNLVAHECLFVNLVDPHFYHMDTCFCPLDTGELLWYPAAFTPESQELIRSKFKNSIEVTTEQANMFSCNAISVYNNIIMPNTNKYLVTKLQAAGYNVKCLDMSEFMKSGGACKCLVLLVNN